MNDPVCVVDDNGYWVCRDPGGSVHGRLYIPKDGRWNFNGDYACPTFSPSMKETWKTPDDKPQCNHFTITDGQVQFHGDCTHEFACKALPLEPFTEAQLAAF